MRIPAGGLLSAAAAALIAASAATPDPGRRDRPEAPPTDAPSLLAGLGAASLHEREGATAGLAALGDAARGALVAASRSEDPEVRSRARGLLGRLADDPASVSALRRRRADALLAAPGLRWDELAPGSPLDLRLRDLAPESGAALAEVAAEVARESLVADRLASALARLGTEDSLAALASLWRGDRLLPSAAVRAAREMDDRAAGDRDREAALRRTARRAAECLGDVLAAREAPRRRAGVALAAAFGGDGATALLVRAAADGDPGVRAEAARALGRHAPGDAGETLRALASDRDPAVRAAALEALARVPGSPHPEPAVAASEDDVPAVRRAAAALLGTEATAAEIPVLARLARDPSPSVRAAAVRSLRGFGIARAE